MQSILYVANVRMPTEKAHGVQIVKTCEAFVRAGARVELVVPNRTTSIREDVATYYGLTSVFPITKLSVPDIVSWGKIGFIIESICFAFRAARFAHHRADLVYGRDEIILAVVACMTSREIVWESHTGSWNIFARFIARRAKKIVVISNGLREFYITKQISNEKIIVAHDGVDLTAFQSVLSKDVARTRLGIHPGKIALYVGALGTWKGTTVLLEASAHLPEDVRIAIITQSDTTLLQKKYPRVLFLGEQPYRDIGSNLAAADVLILPTSGKDAVGARYTSPLKLFTYMASGVPIIASDVPSAKEVLPESAAYWFRADDAVDLARAIQDALSDPTAAQKTSIAKREILLYTWNTRAKRILSKL